MTDSNNSINQSEQNVTKGIPNKKDELIQKKKKNLSDQEKTNLEELKKIPGYEGATLLDLIQEPDLKVNDQVEESKVISLKEKANECLQEEARIKELEQSIFIEQGRLHENVDAAEQILINKPCGIYQRAGKLVRIVKLAEVPLLKKAEITTQNGQNFVVKNGIKRSMETMVIREVDQIYLTDTLTRNGSWIKADSKSKEGIKKSDCTDKIAKSLLARQEWGLSPLAGIINAPTLRSDGSILSTPGYDETSGIFFDNGGKDFPEIKDQPTRDDAIQARDILLEIITDFPFVKNENEHISENTSVMISAMLTALIRRTIPSAPLHGFSAPKMANGKSLLADIVSITATGKSCSVLSHANNEIEEKKRFLALLMDGELIVCIDNIEEPFGSTSLCSILTQSSYKDRILGETKTIAVPTNAFFMATGNNLRFIGDLSTRVILCTIDSEWEHPEERSDFKFPNLRQHILENRGEIVQAALTILRAYVVAGKPSQDIKPFGRFEEWSDLVRSAIVWIEMPDPCLTRKEIENEDPARIAFKNLLIAWFDCFGDFGQRAKEVVKYAEKIDHATTESEALKDALLEFAPDNRGNISPKNLGKRLGQHKGRIEGGYRLETLGSSGGGLIIWRVKKLPKES